MELQLENDLYANVRNLEELHRLEDLLDRVVILWRYWHKFIERLETAHAGVVRMKEGGGAMADVAIEDHIFYIDTLIDILKSVLRAIPKFARRPLTLDTLNSFYKRATTSATRTAANVMVMHLRMMSVPNIELHKMLVRLLRLRVAYTESLSILVSADGILRANADELQTSIVDLDKAMEVMKMCPTSRDELQRVREAQDRLMTHVWQPLQDPHDDIVWLSESMEDYAKVEDVIDEYIESSDRDHLAQVFEYVTCGCAKDSEARDKSIATMIKEVGKLRSACDARRKSRLQPLTPQDDGQCIYNYMVIDPATNTRVFDPAAKDIMRTYPWLQHWDDDDWDDKRNVGRLDVAFEELPQPVRDAFRPAIKQMEKEPKKRNSVTGARMLGCDKVYRGVHYRRAKDHFTVDAQFDVTDGKVQCVARVNDPQTGAIAYLARRMDKRLCNVLSMHAWFHWMTNRENASHWLRNRTITPLQAASIKGDVVFKSPSQKRSPRGLNSYKKRRGHFSNDKHWSSPRRGAGRPPEVDHTFATKYGKFFKRIKERYEAGAAPAELFAEHQSHNGTMYITMQEIVKRHWEQMQRISCIHMPPNSTVPLFLHAYKRDDDVNVYQWEYVPGMYNTMSGGVHNHDQYIDYIRLYSLINNALELPGPEARRAYIDEKESQLSLAGAEELQSRALEDLIRERCEDTGGFPVVAEITHQEWAEIRRPRDTSAPRALGLKWVKIGSSPQGGTVLVNNVLVDAMVGKIEMPDDIYFIEDEWTRIQQRIRDQLTPNHAIKVLNNFYKPDVDVLVTLDASVRPGQVVPVSTFAGTFNFRAPDDAVPKMQLHVPLIPVGRKWVKIGSSPQGRTVFVNNVLVDAMVGKIRMPNELVFTRRDWQPIERSLDDHKVLLAVNHAIKVVNDFYKPAEPSVPSNIILKEYMDKKLREHFTQNIPSYMQDPRFFVTIPADAWDSLNINEEITYDKYVALNFDAEQEFPGINNTTTRRLRRKMVYFFKPRFRPGRSFYDDAKTMLEYIKASETGQNPTVPWLPCPNMTYSYNSEEHKNQMQKFAKKMLQQEPIGPCRLIKITGHHHMTNDAAHKTSSQVQHEDHLLDQMPRTNFKIFKIDNGTQDLMFGNIKVGKVIFKYETVELTYVVDHSKDQFKLATEGMNAGMIMLVAR